MEGRKDQTAVECNTEPKENEYFDNKARLLKPRNSNLKTKCCDGAKEIRFSSVNEQSVDIGDGIRRKSGETDAFILRRRTETPTCYHVFKYVIFIFLIFLLDVQLKNMQITNVLDGE